MAVKPSLQEVLDYAQFMAESFIKKIAMDCPYEQRQEMAQEAYLRIIKAYERLDVTKGWKSFVYNHCRGAVMDYKKRGSGFEEESYSLKESGNKHKHSERLHNTGNSEGEPQSIDQFLANCGVTANFEIQEIKINWELVSRMASQDETIHVFAKFLRGFEIQELADIFNLSRTRIFQLIQAFILRFQDPYQRNEVWFKQICFAFGLCEQFGMKPIDQSTVYHIPVGWSSKPINLDSYEPVNINQYEQLDLFGEV